LGGGPFCCFFFFFFFTVGAVIAELARCHFKVILQAAWYNYVT